MNDLNQKHCVSCESGVTPMSLDEARSKLGSINEWQINDNGKAICKNFQFKNFYRTMAFVNAVAWVANNENHHPDLKVGYNYCHIRYSTHALDGLSMNDFICAAKIDAILAF